MMKNTVNAPQIRGRLLSRRSELRQRLDRVEADRSHRSAPLSADFEEQATERENDPALEAIAASAGGELAAIEHALERIDAGLFGRCEKCGDPIDLQRLDAVPQAVTCRRCL
ncbi:MAG: hypothetical protein RL026_1196 [Pseudomonadota bacterium]|jgi:RNA polymerase-binding transcription factor DksA